MATVGVKGLNFFYRIVSYRIVWRLTIRTADRPSYKDYLHKKYKIL